jgi:phosphoglycerol transferase MdoB-like AlkP superfamily enzyme
MLVLIVILSLSDLRSGRRILLVHNDTSDTAPERFTRTPALGLLYSQFIYERYERGLRLGGQQAMPSATALAMNHLQDYKGQKQQPNIVLVLVESWGLAHDPALRHAMVDPYSDAGLLARYDVLKGTMPFEGATTSGEGRELCQSHLGSYIAQGTIAQLDRCIPLRLHRMGYHTLAVHGFDGEMYDREEWYPKMGFDDIWFRDRLAAAGMPDCDGPFRGSCDAAVAAWLAGRLREPSDTPLFVHWVTLSSHLPIWQSVENASAGYCGVSAATRNDIAICSWAHLIAMANQSVRDLALGELARPTIFVIVGDHAPPFDKDSERAQFSAAEVPYVTLLPRLLKSH